MPPPPMDSKSIGTDSDSPRWFREGVFPVRAYNHHLSLIISLIDPIMAVFCTVYILFILMERQLVQRFVFLILSTVMSLTVGLGRIIMYSTTITVSKQAKNVPILGSLKTLRRIIVLESYGMFLEIASLILGIPVIEDCPLSYCITAISGTALLMLLVVLLCALIPQIHIQLTSAVVASITSLGVLIYFTVTESMKSPPFIAAFALQIVGFVSGIPHATAARFNIKTRRLSLASQVIFRARIGFRDVQQICLVLSKLLFFASCFVSRDVPLFQ